MPKKIRQKQKTLLEQCPAKDRAIIRDLRCIWGIDVTVLYTDQGFRYEVKR